VGNNPVNHADPSGHKEACGVRGVGCQEDDLPEKPRPKAPRGYDTDCFDETPCIGHGGSLPLRWTFHPLDTNVVSEVPIYDYSSYPPRVIGFNTTSYAIYNTRVDPNVVAKGIIRTVIPIPELSRPVSIENVDVVYSATEKGIIGPFSNALEGLGIGSECEVCGPIGLALKALGAIKAANEGITLEGVLRTHDVIFSRPPITTPLDEPPSILLRP
jgi:hypothetical protein